MINDGFCCLQQSVCRIKIYNRLIGVKDLRLDLWPLGESSVIATFIAIFIFFYFSLCHLFIFHFRIIIRLKMTVDNLFPSRDQGSSRRSLTLMIKLIGQTSSLRTGSLIIYHLAAELNILWRIPINIGDKAKPKCMLSCSF